MSFPCNISFRMKKLRTGVPSIGTWFGGHLILKRRVICVEAKWPCKWQLIYLFDPSLFSTGNFNLSKTHIPPFLFVFAALDYIFGKCMDNCHFHLSQCSREVAHMFLLIDVNLYVNSFHFMVLIVYCMV